MVATAPRRNTSAILDVGRVVLTACTLATVLGALLLAFNVRQREGLPTLGAAVAVALSAAVAAIAIRIAAQRLDARLARWECWAAILLPTPILLLLALSVPGRATPIAATILIWVVFLAEEIWWWLRGKRVQLNRSATPVQTEHRTTGTNAPANDAPANDAVAPRLGLHDANLQLDELEQVTMQTESESCLPSGHSQHMTRREENGQEYVEVLARAEFAAGQRQSTLHLAFCPPLESAPDCELHQLEGPEAALKLTQTEPFGVRLELRLQQRPPQPVEVVICLNAAASRLADEPPGDER